LISNKSSISKKTHISIIQLIHSGEIITEYEIANIQSDKGINIQIKTYLEKSDHYQSIQNHIREAKADLNKAKNMADKLHFEDKIQNLVKVEKDFICNTLYLAECLSKIKPRTEKLLKAIELFDAGRIRKADTVLGEVDLLNDQFALISFVSYQRKKIKVMKNDLKS